MTNKYISAYLLTPKRSEEEARQDIAEQRRKRFKCVILWDERQLRDYERINESYSLSARYEERFDGRGHCGLAGKP